MSELPTPPGGQPIFRTADRTIVGFGAPRRGWRPRRPRRRPRQLRPARSPGQRRLGGHRPLDLLIAGVAIAVVVVALLMVVGRGGGTKGKVSLTGTSSTTALTPGFLPGTPGGSVAGDTTTVASTSSTSSTSTSSTSSTSSTTVTPTTTTTAGAATTTATTSTPATTIGTVTDCPASALHTQTATDQPSYSSGQLVSITVTVYNSSARTCLVQHPFPVGTKSPIGVVSGAKLVWAQPPGSSAVIDSPKALNPNGSYLWATAGWNQKDNSGAQVPQGIYQAVANDPPGGGTPQVTFTIGP